MRWRKASVTLATMAWTRALAAAGKCRSAYICPQCLAQGGFGCLLGALRARAGLRLTGHGSAKECEGLVRKGVRQHVGVAIDETKAQVVLPLLQRL